jgi:hypothetical protein
MTSTTSELAEFHDYLGGLMKQGRTGILPEEALDEWRQSHPLPGTDGLFDDLDDVTAVQQALADRLAGDRGEPIDEVMEQIARDNQLNYNRS